MKKWEENIRQVTPYVPGEQPQEENIIKLNTNENPYPPTRKAVEAYLTTDFTKLGLYPDPTASELVGALEKYYGLEEGQVTVGAGSDDVLSLSFLTFFNSDKPILFPDVTYSFYPVWAEVYRIPYECPPLDKDFRIRPEDYKKENGGIVIANPNAPTSLGMASSEIEEILQANPDVIVIVDEAYVDFGGESMLPLLSRYENLLIVRTYSKSRSLAGMRIGFAMGSKELIQALRNVQASINSYPLTRETIRVGSAALEDEEMFQKNLKRVLHTREWAKKELEQRGFLVLDSQTNFLFARHERVSGQRLFEKLRDRGIYVRHFNGERIREYLRITVGTKEQMERLVSTLDELL
ncbi:MAG: histidinol-phosphate transaminase [Lachnospiraceae bacterium]|nr:histidinol-phosphate transaminase [Lachnospiraceae bacterium]